MYKITSICGGYANIVRLDFSTRERDRDTEREREGGREREREEQYKFVLASSIFPNFVSHICRATGRKTLIYLLSSRLSAHVILNE